MSNFPMIRFQTQKLRRDGGEEKITPLANMSATNARLYKIDNICQQFLSLEREDNIS